MGIVYKFMTFDVLYYSFLLKGVLEDLQKSVYL